VIIFPVLVYSVIIIMSTLSTVIMVDIILHIRKDLCTPIAVIGAPAVIWNLSIVDDSLFSFELTYTCLHIINCHSLFHTVVLLLITP
ncbi:hypothetical protein PFISCL1PPCAC_4558, partial [Pristionchus fissidentatus]